MHLEHTQGVRSDLRLIGLVALLASSCTGSGTDKAHLPKSAPDETAPSVSVPAVEVRRVSVAVPARSTGTTEPIRASNIAPQITARVDAVLVTEGQHVQAGAPLVRLDSQEARLRAAEATARAASTEAQARQVASDFTRLAPLAKRGTIPQQRLEQLASQRDALEAAAKAAKAAAAQARQDAVRAVVRAPFAGIISTVAVEAGEMATKTPATKLLRLVDLSKIEVRVQLHERDLARISRGDRAEITIPSLGRALSGKVTYLRPEIDVRTRTAEVVVLVPNQDGALLAGMFAEVTIAPSNQRTALVVPRAAVGMAGDDRFVYLIRDGQARRRVVKVRAIDEERVEIVQGLRETDQIVAGELHRVAEGIRVERQPLKKSTEQPRRTAAAAPPHASAVLVAPPETSR